MTFAYRFQCSMSANTLMYFFFLLIRPPPSSTLFPYTTLFRSVLDRVVLGVHREVVGSRIRRQALGHRPRDEHAVALQPEVPVQRCRMVLLDDERVVVALR